MYLSFVCSEVNLASVPLDIWWIDLGTTIHISMFMQGCLNCRLPSEVERFINVGDGKKVEVEAVADFRLFLSNGYALDLKETFVVPSFR
jgi:hypothetical protein